MTEAPVPTPPAEAPLESWKEIAAHLKRDVRTVKRWEKSEGLPVHRHLHQARSSVYAYQSELDAWRARRAPRVEIGRLQWSAGTALALATMLTLAVLTAGDGQLSFARAAGQAPGSGLVLRQVWAGPDVSLNSTPSPDGRFLTFVDRQSGDLAIRELATGKSRRLTNRGSWTVPEMALLSAVSPDSQQVAYTWYRYNKDSKSDEWELRLVGVDGSGDRLLLRDPQADYLEPRDWSPDGRAILTILSKEDSTHRMALVSVADGSVRVLKRLDWRWPRKPTLSPDGQYLAYDFPPKEGAPERDIFLLATESELETPLVQHAADDMPLGWTPDGKRLLFASDRTGTMDCWSLEVVDGRPQGSPKLIKRDIGRIEPLGITRDGSLYYGLNAGMVDVYVAELDLATGIVLAPPKPVGERFVGSNMQPEWSPDGKSLAYVSARGRSDAPGSRTLVIRSIETGDERELPLRGFRGFVAGPRWCAGASLVGTFQDPEGTRPGIYAVDARSGAIRVLVEGTPGVNVQVPECFADGRMMAYGRVALGQDSRLILVRRDLTTGEEQEIHRIDNAMLNSLAASPDGRWLALGLIGAQGVNSLVVIPATGGEARELVRIHQPEHLGYLGVAWAPDGRQVVFEKAVDISGQKAFEVWAVSVERGEPRKLGLSMPRIGHVRVHPDGRRVAFHAGEARREIWVMEKVGSIPEER